RAPARAPSLIPNETDTSGPWNSFPTRRHAMKRIIQQSLRCAAASTKNKQIERKQKPIYLPQFRNIRSGSKLKKRPGTALTISLK
uniref:hypothetical protein n=1 Tax=Burkholderia gladioli TaxID=28095 RepID=UPI001ABAACEA